MSVWSPAHVFPTSASMLSAWITTRIGLLVLKKGDVPFYEPGLNELVTRGIAQGRLSFTTDLHYAVTKSLVIFIAVGTPKKEDGSADLRYVQEVARLIGLHLDGYKVIVTKSTVPVGTGERLRKIVEEHSGSHIAFDIVSNPEFLREGASLEDFMRPDRIVLGTSSGTAAGIMRDLYRPWESVGTPLLFTDVRTAELIKYASNAFLATKLSFINGLSELCEKVVADIHLVSKGMGLDHRVGQHFLQVGPGYGGSCFPKDVAALINLAEKVDCRLEVIEATVRANDKQKRRMIEKINIAGGGNPQGKRIGILGLTFKPETSDLRESPAIETIVRLIESGAEMQAYDPAGMDEVIQYIPSLTLCRDAYAAAEDANILVIATEWNQFRNLDLTRIKAAMKTPVIVDLRNIYDPAMMEKLGFEYTSIGRVACSSAREFAIV
jgi:UDPglucose 6-dehydrogenase